MSMNHITDEQLTHYIAQARLDAHELQAAGNALWRLRAADARYYLSEARRRHASRQAARRAASGAGVDDDAANTA